MKRGFHYLWRFLFWSLSRAFCYIYLRPKFNFRLVDPEFKMPPSPFIMVANHGMFFDPFLVAHLSVGPVSIMMNEEGFKTRPFVQWYLRNIGAFPKKKGQSDVRAMKTTLASLRAGYSVLIFPEGQTTWDGATQPLYAGVEKLIKKTNAPVVMTRLQGNFCSKPWWSDTRRKGQVQVSRKLLSTDDVANMSADEIRSRMIGFLKNNDIKSDLLQRVTFKGPSPVKGIERFLWICPACRKSDVLTSSDEAMSCVACGASWGMDNRFRFSASTDEIPDIGDLHDVAAWHKQMVKAAISERDGKRVLTQNTNVALCNVTDTGEYPVIARGTLELFVDKMVFTPENGDDVVSLNVEHINDYVFQHKDIFECRCGDHLYKFRFFGHSPMKWVYFFRYLNEYERFEKRGYLS